MYLSNPKLKTLITNAISKRTGLPSDRVTEILEYDGPWTEHNDFVLEALGKAAKDSLELGVPLASALNIAADLTDLGTENIIRNMESPTQDTAKDAEQSFKRMEEISVKTGQSLETVDAIATAYLDCVIDYTQALLESYLKQISQGTQETKEG